MSRLSLEDEHAIASVILDYATAIDQRDWTLLRRCFADKFEGDYGINKLWRSADEITSYMIDRHAEVGRTVHRISNIVTWKTPAGAGARSYVDAVLMPGKPAGTTVEAIGWYDDELERSDERWRIYRRRFTLIRLREL